MAFLYVTEFQELSVGAAGRVGQMMVQPSLAEQAIVNTGATTQSSAFNAATRFVRLHTDTICAIKFGTNPTAIAAGATGTGRMAANQTEYYAVPVGQSYKVAVVAST